MKVVALTVEHQNSADQERRRHKSCFSADQTGAAEVLLLRKLRSIRAAGNEQLQVQRRAALTSPLPPIGPSGWDFKEIGGCPSVGSRCVGDAAIQSERL